MSITIPRKTENVKVADIVSGRVLADCADCGSAFWGIHDKNGTWLECLCDSGYTTKNVIRAVLVAEND